MNSQYQLFQEEMNKFWFNLPFMTSKILFCVQHAFSNGEIQENQRARVKTEILSSPVVSYTGDYNEVMNTVNPNSIVGMYY